MEFESVDCTSCNSGRHHQIGSVQAFGVRLCDDCGLIFVSPRPTAEATDAIYGDSYFDGTSAHGNQSERGGYQGNIPGRKARARLLVDWIRSLSGIQNGRWLDIGCGPGYLVEAAGLAGFMASGVDVSASAVRIGREELGLDLHCAPAESLTASVQPPFAVISMVDTLFHLRQPGSVLTQAIQLLQPGGLLFAGPFDLSNKPNGPPPMATGSDFSSLGIPEHLSFVNQQSMQFLLEKLNMSEIRFLPLPLTPGDVANHKFRIAPKSLLKLLRSLLRKMPGVQRAVHKAAAKSVNKRAGYVIAIQPSVTETSH